MAIKQFPGAYFVALGLCAFVASCSKPARVLVTATPASVPEKRSEVSFGRRQIDQMFADRPDMAGVLADDDPVLLWVIRSMDGERTGRRIYWNDELPTSGAPSECLAPYGYYPPHVCLWAGDGVSGIDKWACLVFELFNLENEKEFTELETKAMEGKLNGAAYTRECANLEYIALRKARKFFDKHPLSGARLDVDRYYARFWETPETFEKYVAQYVDADGTFHNPGEYFKKYYDDEIAPYVRRNRQSTGK